MISIRTPLTKEMVKTLHAGDTVLISGTIYTARDAAHKRMFDLLQQNKPLPFPIKDAILYYVGPSPAAPGQVIGSAGPTTSGRMDAYAPSLIEAGLTGMIGKGLRSQEVVDSMKACTAVYFAATGGAGALLASKIKSAEIVAWEDLGTEAVRKLIVEDFPATVVIDSEGVDLYAEAPKKYRKS